jgi:hypothetical protein
MTKFRVNVRYRTNTGCNTKSMDVEAESMEAALAIASAKVERQRGVVRIDGGDCWPYDDPRLSLWT